MARNWGLGLRLRLAFGVLFILLATVASYAVWSSRQSYEHAVTIQNTAYRQAVASLEATDAVHQIIDVFRLAAGSGEKGALEALTSLEKKLLPILDGLEGLFEGDETLQKRVQEIKSAYAGIRQTGMGLVEATLEQDWEQVGEATRRFDRQSQDLLDMIEVVGRQGTASLEHSLSEVVKMGRRQLLVSTVLGLAGALGFLLLALMMPRRIVGAVKATMQAIRKTAQGDFTFQVEPSLLKRGDELGEMARDVEQMSLNLTGIVRRVGAASDTVALSAKEISTANQDMSRWIQDMAAAAEATAAAMQQMSTNVKETAERASLANELAANAAALAGQGGEVVDQAVAAMSEASQSSRRISKIIDVVNEVAFQTNLLALNASVEAARAGEAGKGFAVVASEVRNLAARSGEAAKEIQALIEESAGKVDAGNDLMADSGEMFREIIASVQRVAATVSEITAGSQEQAATIDEVADAISRMDGTVQQNAAVVEETAAAAENLAAEAERLRELVGQFKLHDEAMSPSFRGEARGIVSEKEDQAPPSSLLSAPEEAAEVLNEDEFDAVF